MTIESQLVKAADSGPAISPIQRIFDEIGDVSNLPIYQNPKDIHEEEDWGDESDSEDDSESFEAVSFTENAPAPTEAQIRQMREGIAAGSLDNDGARAFFQHAYNDGGAGLTRARNEINAYLEQQNSPYRVLLGGVEGPDGAVNSHLLFLRRDGETPQQVGEMVLDIVQNPNTSEHRARSLRFYPPAPAN